MTRLRNALRDESGLTLIELTISMAVMSVIILPLTASFLIGLLESNSTRDRVADAAGAQAISAYVMSDVQSSDTIATSGTCSTYTPALLVGWTDPSTSAVSSFGYVDNVPAGSTQHQLLRVNCTNGQTTVLTDDLDTSGAFVVTCSTDGVVGACSPTTKLVKVVVKSKSQTAQNGSSYTPFTFDFEVRRRVA